MASSDEFRVLPAGDGAFILELGKAIHPALSRRVFALHSALIANPPAGFISSQPTFLSVTVQFDPLVTDAATVLDAVSGLNAGGASPDSQTAKRWRMPVCYDETLGLDLANVAGQCGFAPEEYARRHASHAYLVYMLGGFPGYPFMGDLADDLRVPRLKIPRPGVPAGSIAVAGQFTAIYPRATPGGWNIVGKTPVDIFNPERKFPALFAPGDTVSFHAVGLNEFGDICGKLATGEIGMERFVSEPA
jgi:KipI family sensor histidine kinase inhibitor